MICVYSPDAIDFSTNGIGPVAPKTCTATETLNGEWEVEMDHPIDAFGKWQRLVPGRIVRVPVPAAETPRIVMTSTGSSREIRKVNTPTNKSLRLRSGTGTSYKELGMYKEGTEIVVLDKSNATWYEVACPDGKCGYMYASYLDFVRNETTVVGLGKTVEPRQLRDQPFRIYRTAPSLTGIKVYARHLFYDLADNMIVSYSPAGTDTGAAVVAQISAACEDVHPFTFYSDLDTTAEEVAFENSNPVDALLAEGGVVEKYTAELTRDWFDVFVVGRVGKETSIRIAEGKNLKGVTYDVDETDVVTRIMPTGEKKNGKILYLNEKYIDSARIGDYPHPKWYHLAVEDAKVDDDVTEAQAKTKMRAAAQAEYDKGCDLPVVMVTVDFVNAADTVEFAQYHALQNIFLGDTVQVYARRIGLSIAMRMTQYTFNCLTGKYDKIVLGVATEALEGSTITGKQLPNGELRGGVLAPGSVGGLQLKDGAVGSLHIQAAIIEIAHIAQAAIDQLSANAIDALIARIDQIIAGEITTDELYAVFAQITTLVVGNIQADSGAFEELFAKLGDFLKLYAAYGAFDFADVQHLIANAMIIRQGVGGSVYIDNLAATQASFVSATLGELVVKGADGKYYQIVVQSDGTISTVEVTPTSGEIGAGEMTDGRGIVETTINVVELNAQTIKATEAIIADLFVSALTAEKITVGQAMISSATIPTLYSTVIAAIGRNLRLRGETVSIVIEGEEDGEEVLRVDKNGGHFTDLSVSGDFLCDGVRRRYSGPRYYTVTSFVDVLDALNHTDLEYDVRIIIADVGELSEAVEFNDISGSGRIFVYGSRTTATAGVRVIKCDADITFRDLYAEYYMWHSPHCHWIECNASSTYTASGSDISNAAPTHTKRSGSTWITSYTNVNWQGYNAGNGRMYATFWFPGLTDLVGATILSATVRVKRVSGIGLDNAAKVTAYTATNTGPSGDFSGKTSIGKLGTIRYNETKTFSIPPSAAAVLCAGGCLIFDPGDTSLYSDKPYSVNYAKFYGVGTGYEPKLTVTYELEGETLTAESTFEFDNDGLESTTVLAPAVTPTVATLDYFTLHKVGRVVTFNMRYSSSIAAGSHTELAIIPEGFWPMNTYVALNAYYGDNTSGEKAYVKSDGTLRIRLSDDVGDLTLSGSWITAAPVITEEDAYVEYGLVTESSDETDDYGNVYDAAETAEDWGSV